MPRRNSRASSGRAYSSNTAARNSNTHRRSPSNASSSTQHSSVIPASARNSGGIGGLFSQFATTAAGVAVGNALGRALVGAFTGGSTTSESFNPPQADSYEPSSLDQAMKNHSEPLSNGRSALKSCDADAKAFTECMATNSNDVSMCQYYLDVLKHCQSSAVVRNSV